MKNTFLCALLCLCGYSGVYAQTTLSVETLFNSEVTSLPLASKSQIEPHLFGMIDRFGIGVNHNPIPGDTNTWAGIFNKKFLLGTNSVENILSDMDELLNQLNDTLVEVAGDNPEEKRFQLVVFFGNEHTSPIWYVKDLYLELLPNSSWGFTSPAITTADRYHQKPFSVPITIPGVKHSSITWGIEGEDENLFNFTARSVTDPNERINHGSFTVITYMEILALPDLLVGLTEQFDRYVGALTVCYSADKKLFEEFDIRTGQKIVDPHVSLSIEVIDGTPRLVARGQCEPGPLTIECSEDLKTWREIAVFPNYTGLMAMPLPDNGEYCLFRARTN